MPTQRDQILSCLRACPTGADDGMLSRELNIRHQRVNQICRQLEEQGLVVRYDDPVSRQQVNRLVDSQRDQPDVLAVPPPPSLAVIPTTPGCLLRLHGEEALRQFAYARAVGFTEDQVKQAVEAVLEADGWTADVRWGREHGIDIAARRGTERLVLEVKGEGSRSPMRVNYFLSALGELLQRMDGPNACYGLALPAHRQFVNLVLGLPAWVRTHLDLQFFLVRLAPGGNLEVGVFPSDGDTD